MKPLNIIVGASSDIGVDLSNALTRKKKNLLLTYFRNKKKIHSKVIKNKKTKFLQFDLKNT